jgi:hypothetical protein
MARALTMHWSALADAAEKARQARIPAGCASATMIGPHGPSSRWHAVPELQSG